MSETKQPPKRRPSERRQRDAQILVRLTPEELAQADALADRAGLTRAAFARAAIVGSTGPRAQKRAPVDKAALLQLLGELGRIGNNINQIARAANAGLDLDADALKEAMAAILEMRELTRTALNRRPPDPTPEGPQSRFITPTTTNPPRNQRRVP